MVVTLSGDVISHADINLKLPRPAVGKDLYSNTSIREDAPWQLQQVQDSVNHLRCLFTHSKNRVSVSMGAVGAEAFRLFERVCVITLDFWQILRL